MLAAVYDVLKMAGSHAWSQGTREIVPLRARTLSVIEIYHNVEVSTAFGFLSSVSATSHGDLRKFAANEVGSPSAAACRFPCCHQPSYTIFPGPVRIVNRTCHTSGPGKACLRLTTSIFCWTTALHPLIVQGLPKKNTTANLTACIISIQRTRDTGH